MNSDYKIDGRPAGGKITQIQIVSAHFVCSILGREPSRGWAGGLMGLVWWEMKSSSSAAAGWEKLGATPDKPASQPGKTPRRSRHFL